MGVRTRSNEEIGDLDDLGLDDWDSPYLSEALEESARRRQLRRQRAEEQAQLQTEPTDLSVPNTPDPSPGNTRTITGTAGQPVGRGQDKWRAMLASAVNITALDKADYSLVYCEETVSGVMRIGADLEKAKYVFFHGTSSETFYGKAGLNEALKRFQQSIRLPRRKSDDLHERGDSAGDQEPG
jgi:hypothetical protein